MRKKCAYIYVEKRLSWHFVLSGALSFFVLPSKSGKGQRADLDESLLVCAAAAAAASTVDPQPPGMALDKAA